MPITNGLDRHQLTFSSLEATIATYLPEQPHLS